MHIYPIVTTPHLEECKFFYVNALGARVLFEQAWYLQMALGNFEIGFLSPDPPTRLPIHQNAQASTGLCLAVEMPEVRALHLKMLQRGFKPASKPERFSNGEWTFSVTDPAGVVLNIVEVRSRKGSGLVEI